MRIALIHDFLIRHGGAERVLQALCEIFPEAPIFTLLYDEKKMGKFFPKEKIKTSFLQKFPKFLRNHYKYLLPLLPLAPETMDLRDFDLVVSSSSSFAKGIVPRVNTLHICYCHNPMRFVWDYSHSYLKDQKKSFFNPFMKTVLHFLRIWDRNAAQRVDYFIANSRATQKRIWKYYRRESTVIYPPVLGQFERAQKVTFGERSSRPSEARLRSGDPACSSAFGGNHARKQCLTSPKATFPRPGEEYFLIVSQLTPYKKIDMAVAAFNKLKLPLVIIGEGPERKKLEKMAKENIKFLGWQPDEIVWQYYQNCIAFIFPGEDDFGIAPVEAMGFGKPVLSLRRGGALETVVEAVTGEFFDEPDPAVLADGVRRLRENLKNYDSEKIKEHAQKFNKERFVNEIKNFVKNKVASHP